MSGTAAAAEVLVGRGWLYLLHWREGLHGSAANKPPKRQGLHTDHNQETQRYCQKTAPNTFNFQEVGHGFARCVQAWLYRSDIRWARRQGERHLPPWCAAAEGDAAGHSLSRGWAVYLSAAQCTGALCPWNSIAAWTRDTQIHRSRSVASKQSRSEPSWLQGLGCDAGTCLQVTINDVSELKQRLIEAWSAMQQCVIDKAIDEWRKRLRFCVSAKGRHFEHKL